MTGPLRWALLVDGPGRPRGCTSAGPLGFSWPAARPPPRLLAAHPTAAHSPAALPEEPTISEYTPEQLGDAQATLDASIRALLQPPVQHIDRSSADDDPGVREVDADHLRRAADLRAAHARDDRRLRGAHADARGRRDHPGMRRALAGLIRARQSLDVQLAALDEQAATRRATLTRLPSMLEQLHDAVHSTQGGGGAAAGPHRSPIGLAAAELLADVQRTVRAHPGKALDARLRSWAAQAGHWRTTEPATLLEHAQAAERWVIAGQAILDPTRVTPIPGMCPRCRRRTVRAPDDLGEWVVRPVLALARDEGTVRCTAPCTEAWGPDRLRWLGELLRQQDEDEDEDEAARATEAAQAAEAAREVNLGDQHEYQEAG